MKTSDEWSEELTFSAEPQNVVILRIQSEAYIAGYNQAIMDAAENARCHPYYQKVDKKSILKLLKNGHKRT